MIKYCKECSAEFETGHSRKVFCNRSCKERGRAKRPSTTRTRREAALKALGSRCVKCGTNDIRVLEVDHVNNNGAIERKEKCRSAMLKAIELGKTDGYQALCRNCNYLKYLEYKDTLRDKD